MFCSSRRYAWTNILISWTQVLLMHIQSKHVITNQGDPWLMQSASLVLTFINPCLLLLLHEQPSMYSMLFYSLDMNTKYPICYSTLRRIGKALTTRDMRSVGWGFPRASCKIEYHRKRKITIDLSTEFSSLSDMNRYVTLQIYTKSSICLQSNIGFFIAPR